MSFSSIISQLRKERGLSQKAAAADLGISQALLSHYEKGIRECGLDFIMRAADYYGVTCDYLLGRSEVRTGLSGRYQSMDLPQDELLGYGTIARVGSLIDVKSSVDTDEYILILYAMAAYRAFASLARGKVLPREWLCFDPADANRFADVAMGLIERGFAKRIFGNEPWTGEPPACVRTVIREAEGYIRRSFLKLGNDVQEA